MTKPNSTQLSLEQLETREVPAVISVTRYPDRVDVVCDNVSSRAEINSQGNNVQITDQVVGRSWTYASSQVNHIRVFGGAGADRIVNNSDKVRLTAVGGPGDDYLKGGNLDDAFWGGDGNDTLLGYGGNDLLVGGNGHDILKGMSGNDTLYGESGNDQLFGGAGQDSLYGGDGNDILIALDNSTGDLIDGGAGYDLIWLDDNSTTVTVTDKLFSDSLDTVHAVKSFRNGADRTLDGDRIADPIDGKYYKNFSNYPLFAATGPHPDDVDQGDDGDCWILATLSSMANDQPTVITHMISDFGDGTYGIKLGNSFYRVDADLPTLSATSAVLTKASLGRQGALWAALIEKAYAWHRTNANTYQSLNFGNPLDALRDFHTMNSGQLPLQYYASPTALGLEVFQRWNRYESLTLCTSDNIAASSGLVSRHVYSIISVFRNDSGTVDSVLLRNPWAVDGTITDGLNDGYITISLRTLASIPGWLSWGKW